MSFPFKTVEDLPNVFGKRILIRVDFNVPIREGVVINDFKIRKTLPLLKKLKEAGAFITLVSHLSGDISRSLAPVAAYLESAFPVELTPLASVSEVREREEKAVILLENIRHDAGETRNSPALASVLAECADIFINEAFSVSHREHASVVGIPELLPSYAGPLFCAEYSTLKKLHNPLHPFVVISGGAKFSTKIPLVEGFLGKADTVFVGGALANAFFKARGYEVGASLVSEADSNEHKVLLDERISLPTDVEVENQGRVSVVPPDAVGKEDSILDAGPRTMRHLEEILGGAKTVLWNGPLGNYERGFNRRSTELAHILAKSTAFTVIGGGDTVIAITEAGLEEEFSFISTAGGAMIDFLSNGTLPGIEALKKNR